MIRRWGVIAGIVLGAVLGVLVLARAGVDNVVLLMQRGGANLVIVVLFHVVQIVIAGIAWWTLVRRQPGCPPMKSFVVLRWLREGVNGLIPSGQVCGLVVGVRALCWSGQTLGLAAAGVIADTSVEMGTQVVFTLLGLWVLGKVTGGAALGAGALSGFLLFAGMTVAVLAIQGLGGAKMAERLANRFGWQGANGLHDAITAIYRNRRAVGSAACWHLLAWLLGSAEIMMACHFFGRDIGLGTGLVVESLGQAVRTAGFAVPAALGVQEGGFVLVCGLLHLSPDVALALSLTKRLRDLAFALPATALWLWLERKRATIS